MLPATQLSEALKNVATSTLSKLRNQRDIYINYYLRAIEIISFIGMPLSFFLMIESDDFVLLILGPQWEATVDIFRILSAGTGIWMIYSTKYWLHASLGRSDRLIRWGLLDSLVITMAIIVGMYFGPKGVSLAYTTALYLLTGFGLQYAGKPIGLKFNDILLVTWKNFISALIAGLSLLLIFQITGNEWSRIGRLMISSVLYSSFYLIFVIILNRSIEPITELLFILKEILPKKPMVKTDP